MQWVGVGFHTDALSPDADQPSPGYVRRRGVDGQDGPARIGAPFLVFLCSFGNLSPTA